MPPNVQPGILGILQALLGELLDVPAAVVYQTPVPVVSELANIRYSHWRTIDGWCAEKMVETV